MFPANADEIPIEIIGQPIATRDSEYEPVVDLDLANIPVEPHAYEGPIAKQVLSPDDQALLSPEIELTTPDSSAARASAAAAPVAEEETITNETPIPVGVKLPDVSNTGGLSYDYPIDVPAFRGLEPKLSLNYNSSRKTKVGGTYQGWLGYGWSLEGVPVIERMRPKMGIPSFQDSKIEAERDIYALNGQPLFKCSDSRVSDGASCLAGGNYVAEVENYLKISFNTSTRQWKVTGRDGTVTTFKAVGDIAPPSTTPAAGSDAHDLAYRARWMATSIEDTNGNTVSFAYSCVELPLCYVTSITYNKRTISFLYEDRPDFVLMANGHTITTIKRRIEAILVKTGASETRGYQLDYSQAAGSGASQLASIQQFGSDLVLGADGRIASGTSLPITTFSYNAGGRFTSAVELESLKTPHFALLEPNIVFATPEKSRDRISITDVDSNGASEIFLHSYKNKSSDTCIYYLYHSPLLDGVFSRFDASALPCQRWLTSYDGIGKSSKFVENYTTGHFAGDVRQTQMLFWKEGLKPSVEWEAIFTKNGNSFDLEVNRCGDTGETAISDTYVQSACDREYPAVIAADPDGNGRDGLTSIFDTFIGLTSLYDDGTRQRISSAFSGGVGAYEWVDGASVHRSFPGAKCYQSCTLVDLNGDGLDDIVELVSKDMGRSRSDVNLGYALLLRVLLFTGDRYVEWLDRPLEIRTQGPGQFLAEAFATDRDGDGKSELVLGSAPSSHGDFGYTPDAELADSVAQRVWKSYRLALGPGGKTFQAESLVTSSWLRVGDFNGDGQTDIVYAPPVTSSYERDRENQLSFNYDASGFNNPYLIRYGSSSVRIANILSQVVTQEGAQLDVSYEPSARWANTFMPFSLPTVTAIKISDGRGGSATTGYSYSKGYYYAPKRKFLGFGVVVKTLPRIPGEDTSPTVTTTYRQDLASIGLPAKIVTRDATGTTRVEVSESYTVQKTTLPYSAQNTFTTTIRREDGSDHALKTKRTFDAYGNVVTQTDYGRDSGASVAEATSVDGDEVSTHFYYNYNLPAYIVSAPRAVYIFGGIDDTAAPIKQTRYQYDGLAFSAAPTKGNLTTVSSLVKSGKWITTSYTNSDSGNRETETNAEGIVTAWTYDGTFDLYPTRKTIDGFTVMTAAYSGVCEQPSRVIGINGVGTDYVYDNLCREISATRDFTDSYVKTAYNSFGDPLNQRVVTTTSLPKGGYAQKTQYFDGRGQVRRVVQRGDASSAQSYIDMTYDARGNVRSTSYPYTADEKVYQTLTSYDWDNRPVKITNPGDTAKTFSYSGSPSIGLSGNLPLLRIMTTDEEGRQTATWKSTWGDTIAATQYVENANTRILYGATYDAFHRLTKVRDHSGANWAYSYDMVGNRLSADDPDLGTWTYTYDDANRLVTQTDARGKKTEIAYNSRNEVVSKKIGTLVLATNTYASNNTGGYYNRGRLVKSVNPHATIEYNYNADGLLASKSSRIGSEEAHVEESFYDAGKLPLYKEYWRGAATTPERSVGTGASNWLYNVKGQLKSIPGYISAITYELDGQTSSITYANGVTTAFTYSLTRRWLTRVNTIDKDGATIFVTAFVRDATGRITRMTTNPGSNYDYTYDDYGRLTAATTSVATLNRTYAYSLSGNMTSNSELGTLVYPSATGERPHTPTSIGGQAVTYDANGNMTGDGERMFTWDDANRLSKVTMPNGNGTSLIVTFTYGPDGARVKKTSTEGTTLYPDASVEFDPATAVYTRYPHPDLKIVGASKYFLHRDNLASVRAVTNNVGAITEQTRYYAYGQPTNTGMTTQKNYIGERRDAETGLLYLNARYMDPKLGRFISPDDRNPTRTREAVYQ